MASEREIKRTGVREVAGIALIVAGLVGILSLVSYAPGDIPLLQSPPHQPPLNFIGRAGAWVSFGVLISLGVVAFLLPVCFVGFGIMLVVSRTPWLLRRLPWCALILTALVCIVEMQPELWHRLVRDRLNIGNPGGMLGLWLGQLLLLRYVGHIGTAMLCTVALIASVTFLFEIKPRDVARRVAGWVRKAVGTAGDALDAYRDRAQQLAREEREVARQRRKLERSLRMQAAGSAPAAEPGALPAPVYARTVGDVPEDEPMPVPPSSRPPPPAREPPPREPPDEPPPPPPARAGRADGDIKPVFQPTPPTYQLPPIDLLRANNAGTPEIAADLATSATVLEETLRDFGIECKVTNVEKGPVVTRFELLPAAGIRVERIAGLSNNIALALKAVSVRVQAPIPGKGVVGIEVPNPKKAAVYLRELLESDVWTRTDYALPLALGKDVGGGTLIADLAAMPHLLIAGATGSGKTVCMNSLLAGLLMSRTPDQMRLMLVDPKIVEFGPYNDLPHLVVPVITDPKKVSLGLRWAINEMEKRYKIFAKAGVRNIRDFNHRPRVEQTDLFGEAAPANKAESSLPDTLPYIAIVIDELADLMLVAQAEIENSIARLAQLSRAVGIHMIIATQRPSVNVITGTIKANFPGRIAFQVAQKVDSRTILDTVGAEKLLGKGDLLFLPPGSSKVVRAQGSFTGDDEIQAIVEFIKRQGEPSFVSEVHDKIEGKVVDLPPMDEDDDLLDAAVEIIRQTRRASTSSLQRRLRIGYTRAARLMDVLEEKGIIGPPSGSDPREILIDLDGDIPENQQVEPPSA